MEGEGGGEDALAAWGDAVEAGAANFWRRGRDRSPAQAKDAEMLAGQRLTRGASGVHPVGLGAVKANRGDFAGLHDTVVTYIAFGLVVMELLAAPGRRIEANNVGR